MHKSDLKERGDHMNRPSTCSSANMFQCRAKFILLYMKSKILLLQGTLTPKQYEYLCTFHFPVLNFSGNITLCSSSVDKATCLNHAFI